MTFFETILKKRLGNATSDKGVAPDDLWAAIEQGLPPEKEKGSSFKWRTIGLTLLGVFVALSVSLSILLQKDEGNTDLDDIEFLSENVVEIAEAPTRQVREEGIDAVDVIAGEKGEAATKKGESLQSLAGKGNVSKPADSENHISAGSSERIIDKALATNESAEASLSNNAKDEPVVTAAMTDERSSGTKPSNVQVFEENLAKDEAKRARKEKLMSTGAVPANDLKTIPSLNEVAVSKLNLPTTIAPLVRNKKELLVENFKSILPIRQLRRPRAELGVFVGTNMLRHRYPSAAADDLADVLNASRGEALGQSAALEVGYRLKPGLKLYSGVELLKTHTTFRYTQQRDTVMMRNGREIDAVAIRRVQHNNRQTLLSVPLMLEKTFASGRWEAGLSAGISFNYLTQQTGRSLNALQQIVTYSNGGGVNLPAPDFYLSYQIRPSINYRLNSQVRIQARADLRWQRYGQSALYELSANSMLYGGSIGVVFGL
ncbi:porin family protein [Neolewinella persica]|uniref:hypothetical protein n=1 Tax=Neolewinella persica TaxID=70998 RepID=UPI000380F63D|nr:hypothetical protein [Neolewinella persica]